MLSSISILTLLVALVVCQGFQPLVPVSQIRARKTELAMGGKMAKFGIFSPAVYAAKFALGDKKLEKVRYDVK